MHHYFGVNVMHVCETPGQKNNKKVSGIALLWCAAEDRLKLVFCVSREMSHAGEEDHVSLTASVIKNHFKPRNTEFWCLGRGGVL